MRSRQLHTCFAILLMLMITVKTGFSPPAVYPHELTGHLSAEGRLFIEDPLFPGQKHNNGSLAFRPEYYHEWQDGSSFTFVPFLRIDSADR